MYGPHQEMPAIMPAKRGGRGRASAPGKSPNNEDAKAIRQVRQAEETSKDSECVGV